MRRSRATASRRRIRPAPPRLPPAGMPLIDRHRVGLATDETHAVIDVVAYDDDHDDDDGGWWAGGGDGVVDWCNSPMLVEPVQVDSDEEEQVAEPEARRATH